MDTLNLDRLREILQVEVPRLIREHPETRHEIWGMMLEAFPSRGEFDTLLEEVRDFHQESGRRFDRIDQRFDQIDQHSEQTDQRLDRIDQHLEQVDQRLEQVDQRFEQVDQRFEQVDQRFDRLETEMREGFLEVQKAIDRLGSRWGIRNESLFRQTITALLEESFGAKVQSRVIQGEQFDIVISDGNHILIEIAASTGPKMQERLERKRRLYVEETDIEPARMILATASIHSQRAQALREAGFQVIEPEEEAL